MKDTRVHHNLLGYHLTNRLKSDCLNLRHPVCLFCPEEKKLDFTAPFIWLCVMLGADNTSDTDPISQCAMQTSIVNIVLAIPGRQAEKLMYI